MTDITYQINENDGVVRAAVDGQTFDRFVFNNYIFKGNMYTFFVDDDFTGCLNMNLMDKFGFEVDVIPKDNI
jgi:hypothetical protein